MDLLAKLLASLKYTSLGWKGFVEGLLLVGGLGQTLNPALEGSYESEF